MSQALMTRRESTTFRITSFVFLGVAATVGFMQTASTCSGRIFSSVKQLGDMMVSHPRATGSRDADRPIRGER